MFAEKAYLFRHAVLRDAAYQLQLPGDRAKLHALALAVLEDLFPTSEILSGPGGVWAYQPSSADALAAEMALHAACAREVEVFSPELRRKEVLYTFLAAEYADSQLELVKGETQWLRLAELAAGDNAANAWRRAGVAARSRGELARAEEHLRHALDCLEGNVHLRASTCSNLGAVLGEMSRAKEAREVLHEAIALFRQCGEVTGEATATVNLALPLIVGFRTQEALELLLGVQEALKGRGQRRLLGVVLDNIGTAYFYESRVDLAEAYYRQAITIADELGFVAHQGQFRVDLARALGWTRRRVEERATLDEALVYLRRCGNRRSIAEALGCLAQNLCATHAPECERAFLEALALHADASFVSGEMEVSLDYALFLSQRGRHSEAELRFSRAIDLAERISDVRGQGVAKCEMAICLGPAKGEAWAQSLWASGEALLKSLPHDGESRRVRANMLEARAEMGLPPLG